MTKNTEAAVVALATADATSNMTALQRAAHDVVSGSKLATKGRVGMTFELASLILAEDGTPVTFTHDKETFTRPLLDYLLGEEENGKKNNKRLFAFWVAIRDILLGTDPADDGIIRSAFVACLRSAAGVAGLAERPSAVSLTKDGANVVLRAGHALTLQDNAGKPTKAGKAVFEEAARREKTRAEIRAELTTVPVRPPTEAEIWEAAFEMPIVCDGTTLPGSDVPVPTNTDALAILREAGVETGMAPARKGRAPRTPSGGDGADAAFETALTLLTEQLSAIAGTDESPVDLDKHGAALLALRDLINTLEI